MPRLKTAKAQSSYTPGIGELTFLGSTFGHPFTYVLFFTCRTDPSNHRQVNNMGFALSRVFGQENVLYMNEFGYMVAEKLGERVRNIHGLVRNRLSRIEKAFLDIERGKARLTHQELFPEMDEIKCSGQGVVKALSR